MPVRGMSIDSVRRRDRRDLDGPAVRPVQPRSATVVAEAQPPRAPRVEGSPRAVSAARVTGTALAPGVELKDGRLLVDGFAVIERATLRRSGGRALAAAAARVAETGALMRLASAQRLSLVEDLLPLLEKRSRGRASIHDVAARAGAFSLLEQLAPAMRTRDEAGALRRISIALIDAAAREPHAGLKTHMERRLVGLPERVLPKAQQPRIADIADKLAHEHPLREQWMKGTPPTLKVLASVQDEFWKKELAAYKKDGYVVKELGRGKAIATKDLPEGRIEIDLRERDTDVLDGIAERDVDVVLYTGHANLGGVAKTSLANGPANAAGTKLIAFFSCRSKQSLPAIERAYPGQHLLVSDKGTYGHDDAIVSHALLEGIVRGKSYAEIERAARKQGLWEKENYVFPHEAALRIAAPVVYVARSKTAQGTSVSMRPRKSARRAADVPRGPVDDSVAWLNTIHGYWAEQFGNKAVKAQLDNIVARGWFDGAPSDPVVKVTKLADGTHVVRVNSSYAHQDPDALAMLVTFHAALAMLQETRPQASVHERRMLALAMVSSYVYFLVEYSDVADVLLRQFAKEHKFPPGLTWPVVEKAVLADMKNDCSPKVIAALERGMEYPFLEVNPTQTTPAFRRYVGKALELLRASKTDVGKRTWHAIVTGEVLVDRLQDLWRKDYARLRREMEKEGSRLPVQPDQRAFRAITTSINGYAWDDRVYVADGLSPLDLASTLVHEVNHVLNKSEEHYRGDKAILLEEYRAFYAEEVFRGEKMTAAKCRALKERVIADYGLKKATVADVPDTPPGLS